MTPAGTVPRGKKTFGGAERDANAPSIAVNCTTKSREQA
jgi:hypothetical protein